MHVRTKISREPHRRRHRQRRATAAACTCLCHTIWCRQRIAVRQTWMERLRADACRRSRHRLCELPAPSRVRRLGEKHASWRQGCSVWKKERMKDKGVATAPPSGPLKTAQCPRSSEFVLTATAWSWSSRLSLHPLLAGTVLFSCAVHSA